MSSDEHATAEAPGLPGEETAVEGPYASAFDALFQPGEAANLKVRAKLMRRLTRYIEEEGLSQTDAAERLGTGQPRFRATRRADRPFHHRRAAQHVRRRRDRGGGEVFGSEGRRVGKLRRLKNERF